MASKHDVQLIRLACRRRWLTAEQGEDCLFLKRKLGDKLTIEQILRQRQYLNDDEIAELAAAAKRSPRRRPSAAIPPSVSMVAPVERPDVLAEPLLMRPVSRQHDATLLGVSTEDLPGPKTTEGAPIDVEDLTLGTPPVSGPPTLLDTQAVPAGSAPEPGEHTIIGPIDGFAPPPSARGAEDATLMDLDLDRVVSRTKRRGRATKGEQATPRAADSGFDASADAPTLMIESPLKGRGDGVDAPTPVVLEPPPSDLETPPSNLETPPSNLETPPSNLETPPSDLEPTPSDLEPPPSDFASPPSEDVDLSLTGSLSGQLRVSGPTMESESPEVRADALSHQVGAMTGIHHRVPPQRAEAAGAATIEGNPLDAQLEEATGPFGPYDLQYLVARGSRSAVYRATHVELGRDVALKVLLAPGRTAAAFVSERGNDLVSAARLDHPRIVRVLDVGNVANRYYVALDYAPGWALDDKLAAERRLPPPAALQIAVDIAEGLAVAEAAGVVHRDVRPDHAIVDDEGRARLTGFGFFGVHQGRPGTPGYMAPEVASGGAPTTIADQFGLGAILFRMVTGRDAFDAETDEERLRLSREVKPPDPRLFRPELPPAVAQLCLRLMAWAPDQRFENFVAVTAALASARSAALVQTEDVSLTEAVPVQPLMTRAVVLTLALMLVALSVPLVLDLTGLAPLRSGGLARPVAFGAAVALTVATLIHATVALIRRGELPLPVSSGWLVRGQEFSGIAGATLLVAGFAVAPPAILNVGLAMVGVGLLASGWVGALLRRAVAAARGERGAGRVLGVLGDFRLVRWRHLHVPGLTAAAAVAVVRWMALAYFAAS